MKFEWDENKHKDVWEKHGVDLLDVALMLENEDEIEFYRDPRHAGERRITAIGKVDGVWYCLTYEDRDSIFRLITGWKLNEKSKRKAQARLARRAAKHEEPG